MSQILVGAIIGGAIAVVGSGIVALIQGYYSLKNKREENLARQEQQSIQIEYEKSSGVISRIIEIRSRYLNPLYEELAELHKSIDDFKKAHIGLTVLYPHQEYEIEVTEEGKEELKNKLNQIESKVTAMETSRGEIYGAIPKATDGKLVEQLWDLVSKVYDLVGVYREMCIELRESRRGEDFIYDFRKILEPANETLICIADTNGRIESLLAGAEIDGE